MVRILSVLALSILISSLSGCAFWRTPVPEIKVVEKPIEKTPLNLSLPDPLKISRTRWIIITKDNAQRVFEELEKSGSDPVIFGISDKGYEEMSMSFAQIRNFISSQQQIILKYKEYYEPNAGKK